MTSSSKPSAMGWYVTRGYGVRAAQRADGLVGAIAGPFDTRQQAIDARDRLEAQS